MLIVGVKNKILDVKKISDPCPFCKATDSLQMTFFQQYVSLFWIPFFPSKKHANTLCSHCNAEFLLEYMSPNFREIYEDIKTKNKTPLWTFTGTLIAIILLVSLAFAIKIDSDNTRKRVAAPQINDLFEIKLKSDKYTIYKVQKVEHDSVYFFANKFEVDAITGITDLYNKEFDESKSYGLPITKFTQMNEDGEIIGAKRK